MCDWAYQMCFGPTPSGLNLVLWSQSVRRYSLWSVLSLRFVNRKTEDLKPWNVGPTTTDLIQVTQKVHIPPKPQSSNRRLTHLGLGVPCVIRRQLLLVGYVVISWWSCPVEETTLPHG